MIESRTRSRANHMTGARWAAGVLAGLALAGCAGQGEKPVYIKFDDLGANDPRIMVYPGPSTSAEDRQPIVGEDYTSGTMVAADCWTEGRIVTSVAPETDRTDNRWIKLQNVATDKRAEYTTAVYIQNPEQVFANPDFDKC